MAAEKKEVIRFESVSTGYGKHEVIKDFSASVYQGEFVGLIGANGMGKSTLIKAVSGLLPITGGKITIDGKDNAAFSQKERARRLAVVPQVYDIDYEFTVEDIVMMGRNPYLGFRDRESEKDHAIVREAMKLTQTEVFKDRFINALSGGEKQRVIIARAIAQQTDIILLDEPTSALDVNHQIQIMELMVQLNKKQNKTIMAVLHDLNLAARYCDRLIMIDGGKVVADGTPVEVITDANMKTLYNMKMLIRQNPVFEKPEVVPIRVFKPHAVKQPWRIHLICGAGGAARLMDELTCMGHDLSAGVVPRGSDDWLMGQYLGVRMVEIPPFTEVTPEAQKENLDLMSDADILFIADVPFGNGNIENLKGLDDFQGQIVFHRSAIVNDFTEDKVVKAIADQLMAEKKAVIVDDHDHFLRLMTEWQDAYKKEQEDEE